MKFNYIFIYKLIRKLIRYSIILLSIFPVIIIRLLRPIVLIRFIHLHSEIMGDFACQPAIYLSNKKINRIKSLDLCYLDKIVANTYWLKMCKKKFYINSIFKYLRIANSYIPFGGIHDIHHPITRDLEGNLSKCENHFNFNDEENKIAKQKIKLIGIEPHEKFICLIVRDSEYKKNMNQDRDYSYHEYRNTDIRKLKSAVNFLSDKGYKVLRMGKFIDSSSKINDIKMIDYANSKIRSDFLDIWLFANCFFCITPGTGIDEISRVFKRPSLCINHLPILDIVSYDNCTTIPKRLFRDGNELNLTNHLTYSFFNDKFYKQNNITVKELNEIEILKEVQSYLITLNNINSENDQINQKKFWEIMKKDPRFDSFHGVIHKKARISANFIDSNPSWLS